MVLATRLVYTTLHNFYNKELPIEKTWDKRFACFLLFSYKLKEDLITRLELNSHEKMILFSRDTTATSKLLDTSLEADTILNQCYTRKVFMLGKLSAGTT